jgi:hypothetical protein
MGLVNSIQRSGRTETSLRAPNPLELRPVRRLRVGLSALSACLLILAGGTALAAEPQQAVFKVTLTGNLTKDWSFTRVEEQGNCTRTTRGSGRWQLRLSSRRPGRVRAIAGVGGRVRFSDATVTAIGGTATRSGTIRVTTAGSPPCERGTRSVRCPRQKRTFTRGSSSLRSPRKGFLRLTSLRGASAARSFPSGCLDEPTDIRAIRTDLPLATGPLDAGDVFGRDISRFFVTGNTEQVTTLDGDVTGRVTERVRWTLVFTRLPH